MIFFLKVIFASLIISFASWLSFKKPSTAGFIVALPLVSIITILFSYLEYKDFEKTITFSKNILIAIPLSVTFFIPFFFAKTLGLNFWFTYSLGILILFLAYILHKYLSNFL